MTTIKIMTAGFLVLVSGGSAYAATTGNIAISGIVPASTAIAVNTVSGYNSLNLAVTAAGQVVANIQETNNTVNGYTVTMSSQNAGTLKNGTLGSLAYTAKYNNAAVTLSTTAATITTSGASTAVVNVSKPLAISYTGVPAASMMQGTYSDTLTFTITAN